MNLDTSSPAESQSPAKEKLVLRLNLSFGIGFIAYLALFAQIFWAEQQPLIILIVATAALNAGAFIGFLYSTFGEEEKKFSQMFVAVNGLLGGATLTDLLHKDKSVLVQCLQHLTLGCGLDEKYAGAVFAVIITCLPIGFLWLYLNRKLVLNEETAMADGRVRQYEEARKAIENKPPAPAMAGDPKPEVDAKVEAAACVLTNRPDVGKSGTTGSLLADANSFYLLGKYEEAIPIFKKVLAQRPNQPEAMMYLGSALVATGKYVEAADILEQLTLLPSAPITAYKLLGYAYLFYPADRPDSNYKLQRAVEVSEKYLAFEPTDPGASLNLACAYGQLGPEDAAGRQKVLSLLDRLIKSRPEAVTQIKTLMEPGQDFEKWRNVAEFKQLLKF